MRCDEAREELPAFAGEFDAPLALRRHLTECSDCRSEMARYGSLLDSLSLMRDVTVAPPPGLAASVSAIPSQESALAHARQQVTRHVSDHRRVYAGAAVAVLGATGAALWRSRRHRLAPA